MKRQIYKGSDTQISQLTRQQNTLILTYSKLKYTFPFISLMRRNLISQRRNKDIYLNNLNNLNIGNVNPAGREK